jgi:hypothetical protein
MRTSLHNITDRLLVAALIALCLFTLPGCTTRNASTTAAITDAPTRLVTTTTDRQGRITETIRDNSGRAAAADGQAVASTEGVLIALSQKLEGNEWTYTENLYSTLDLPNREVVETLKKEHKNLLGEMSAAAAAGAQKDYDDLAARAASIAAEIGKRLAGAISGGDDAQGDKISVVNRTLSVGKNHILVPHAQAEQFGLSVRARAANQNTLTTTRTTDDRDTTTPDELKTVADAQVRLADLTAKIRALEIEASKSVPPSPVSRPSPVPSPPSVPASPDSRPQSPDSDSDDALALPGAEPSASARPLYDSLAKKAVLYKTKNDPKPVSRFDAALLLPRDRPKPADVEISGLTIAQAPYYAPSEERWVIRLKGSLADTPGSATVMYDDGGIETFKLKSLAGRPRTEFEPGPYKPPAP